MNSRGYLLEVMSPLSLVNSSFSQATAFYEALTKSRKLELLPVSELLSASSSARRQLAALMERVSKGIITAPIHFLLKVVLWPRFTPYEKPATQEVYRAFEEESLDAAMTAYKKEVGWGRFTNLSLALARDGMKVFALYLLGTSLLTITM